jgi:hypothetical protein
MFPLTRAGIDCDALVRQPALCIDVVRPDQPVRHRAAFHHMENLLVRRERQSVRRGEVGDYLREPAIFGCNPVDRKTKRRHSQMGIPDSRNHFVIIVPSHFSST